MNDVAEHSPDPSLAVSAGGLVTWVNAAGRSVWGPAPNRLDRMLGPMLGAEVMRLGAELAGLGDQRDVDVSHPDRGPARIVIRALPKGGLAVYLLAGRPAGHDPSGQKAELDRQESVGRLAGGIAHDFNNLLLAIIGHADLIETDAEATQDIAESATEIRTAGERAAGITRQLLAYGRRERVRLHHADVRDTVKAAAAGVQGRSITGIDVVTDLPDTALIAHIDAARLERVLIELAEFATSAASLASLTLRAYRQRDPGLPDGICCEVYHPEQAFPTAALPHLFEPYFAQRELGRGTSMGLASAYGTIQQHGGKLIVQSAPDTGTLFRICLPAVVTITDVPANAIEAAPRTRLGRVLVAEADPRVQSLVRRVLHGAGFQVVMFSDSEGALQAFRQRTEPWDLALIDAGIKGQGGLITSRKIRELDPNQRVVLTANAGENLHNLAPGVSVLTKPYLPDDLLAEVAHGLSPAV